jgi:hypothetical protein
MIRLGVPRSLDGAWLAVSARARKHRHEGHTRNENHLLDWTSGSRPDARLACEDDVANYSMFSGVLRPARRVRNGERMILRKDCAEIVQNHDVG